MSFDHDTLVWFSKSFGLFYLIALSVVVLVYAYWPSNKTALRPGRGRRSCTTRTGHGGRGARSSHRLPDDRA